MLLQGERCALFLLIVSIEAKKMLGNWKGQNMCRVSFWSFREDPAKSQCHKSRLLEMMASLLYFKARRAL